MYHSRFAALGPSGRPISFLVIAVALALRTAATAQEPGSAEFGFEQRVRNENWNNLFDFNGKSNDEREQIRYRTRVWTRLPLTSSIDFNFGLNSESCQKFGQRNGLDEVVFETANLNFRKLFVQGLSLKIGRQDLTRGEGLILLEGTPGDGSRSTYFNGFDLAYTFRKSTVEAIGIVDPHADRYLPRIHDRRKPLTDWDEQAVGLYYTDRNLPKTAIEAYFFHKKEIRDRLAPNNPQFQPDRRIETAGARVVHKVDKHWTVTAEGAKQWGAQHPSTPISAWAGYGHVKRTFDTRWTPYLLGGFWALSGDDPSRRDRITGWDPLFSRWPKWGDLELYAGVPEKGVGYATNQKRAQLEAGVTPSKRLACRFTYYRVTAFHPFAGNPGVFGTGTNRGQNLQARLDFTIRPELRGHVAYETLLPGSFYAHRGRAYFLRFEMIAQIKTAIPDFKHRLLGD
jgi:hypothetical protein